MGQGVLYIVPPCPKPGTDCRKYTGHAFVCFREPVREPLAYTLENGNQAIPQILKKLFDVRHQIVYKFPERPAIIVKKFKGSGKRIDYQQQKPLPVRFYEIHHGLKGVWYCDGEKVRNGTENVRRHFLYFVPYGNYFVSEILIRCKQGNKCRHKRSYYRYHNADRIGVHCRVQKFLCNRHALGGCFPYLKGRNQPLNHCYHVPCKHPGGNPGNNGNNL